MVDYMKTASIVKETKTRRLRAGRIAATIVLVCGAFFAVAHAQIVSYYPPEVRFGLVGATNNLPGCSPDLYSPFSSARLVYHTPFLQFPRVTNTFYFQGTYQRYLSDLGSGNYNPFTFQPKLNTYFFVNDIFTAGLDMRGKIFSIPGMKNDNTVFNIIRTNVYGGPFHYLFVTPDLIFREQLSFGISDNTDKTAFQSGMYYNDYSMLRYDGKLILLTPFHTRVLTNVYLFSNSFDDLPAATLEGDFKKNNPTLCERGYGIAAGAKYYHYRWGQPEFSIEYVRNFDRSFGSSVQGWNDYDKISVRFAWENQYFIRWFGYLFQTSFSQINADNDAMGMTRENLFGKLWRYEAAGDIIAIFNINRNVSFRPEYDVLYQKRAQSDPVIQNRFWLNINVIISSLVVE